MASEALANEISVLLIAPTPEETTLTLTSSVESSSKASTSACAEPLTSDLINTLTVETSEAQRRRS